MHFLAALSMKNRALIALVTVVVALFGGISLTSLKQELAPSISFPQLSIISSYPGASPEIVNSDVSTPIETAIQGITGLESTATTSSNGVSRVSASFTYGTDLAFAEQKLLSAVNRIRATLPDGVDPQVVALSLDDFPVIQVAVTGATDSASLADDVSRVTLGELKKIKGVRDATIVGNVGKRVTITPDAAKLAIYGLTTQAVRDALKQNGVLLPAGTLTEDGKTYSVQAGSRVDSVDAVGALPLLGAKPVGPTAPVITATPLPGSTGAAQPSVTPEPAPTIADVATVALDNNPTSSISRVNGEPALTIAVTKLPAANTVDVANAVKQQLPELQSALAGSNAGATFTTVFDQAPYIQRSIDSLATEGALGLAFAVLIILLFLFSVRATLVTAISIPTSVLITFIGLQATGYTLNILTLGALTIAIGRVVDDSIVVIENIKRHLIAGADRASTIVHAVREVAGAITASTITTVAVFLPIALVGGVTGELFRPFSLTVTIALLASLLVSLTIVPVLAYWFLRPEKQRKHADEAASAAAFVDELAPGASGVAVVGSPADDDELDHPTRLQRGYLPILRWTLKHGVVTVLLALLVLGGTIGLSPLMKTNFLGSSGQNTFQVTQVMPPGTSLAAVDAAAKPVETVLRNTDGVKTVQVSIGGGSGFSALFSSGGARVTYSITTEESANQDKLQASVRDQLGRLHDVGTVTVTASSGFGASSDLLINVHASNAADLQKATTAVADQLRGLKSLAQVTTNLDAAQPFVSLVVDKAAAAKAGYSDLALSGYVSQAMSPAQIGSVVLDEKSITVYLAPSSVPATIDELKALEVPTRTGSVRLDTLAKVELTDGPSSVTTSDQLRSASVSATPASDNLATANADVTKALASVALPAGTSATIGGVTADQSEAFGQLGLALLAAIMIVYIVMVATFRSLLQPLLLLVSVPFAATGAIALQVITGVPLGVASMIGVLMLVGIVVTNAIVLVDLVNQYRDRGMTVRDALLHGASRRLRPILMTALATIFALLPMALGLTGHSGFISQPLALVVIGGLLSSTVLTLIVLPTLYGLVEGRRERRRMRRAAAAA